MLIKVPAGIRLWPALLFCFLFKASGAIAESLSMKSKAQSMYITQGGSYSQIGDVPALVDSLHHRGIPFMEYAGVFCQEDSTTYQGRGGVWVPIVYLKPKDTISKVMTAYRASGLYKPLSYTPSGSEITTALGFTPYSNANPAGYISSVPAQSFASLTGKPTTLAGYGITDAYPLSGNPSGFVTSATSFSGKTTTDLPEGSRLYFTDTRSRSAISLTTTGTGAATYNNSTGILNIPTGGSGTVTSVGLSSSDLAVSGSPVTSSGSITANLSTTGISAGTYRAAVTYDTKGRATSAINPTVNNSVSRSLSNAAGSTNRFTISATQPVFATYSITMTFTITALLSSSATVFLEYSVDAGSNWVIVSQCTTSFGLGLALTGSNDMSLSGYIPANALVRLRPAVTNATASYLTGQEVLY